MFCLGENYAVQQLQLLSGSLFKKNQSELARGSKFNVNIDVNRVIAKCCRRECPDERARLKMLDVPDYLKVSRTSASTLSDSMTSTETFIY